MAVTRRGAVVFPTAVSCSCHPRKKIHRRRTQQARCVQTSLAGDRLLGPVQERPRDARECRGSRTGSGESPPDLVCGVPFFVFPFGAKTSSYENGTLTPLPTFMVLLPPYVLWVRQGACTPFVHVVRRAKKMAPDRRCSGWTE